MLTPPVEVQVRYLVAQLRLLCESPDCRRERLYMGRQCNNGEVITAPGHKWNNEVRAVGRGARVLLDALRSQGA